MSDKSNKITVYRGDANKPIPGWQFHAASPKRKWMDEYKHMYRCLPMTIANQNGWVIECPCDIQAVWFGGQDRRSMHFWLDPEYNVATPWVKCHFVGGVITFEFDFMIRTDPGINLLVRGAPNFFVDGAHPLEGVVETDWLNFSFTMNWPVTTPNKIVYFKKGDPICFLQPIPHNYAERFDFKIDFLKNNPELKANFDEYNRSRKQFAADKWAGKHNEDWQKHYFTGKDVKSGTKVGNDVHAIKLNIKEPDTQNLTEEVQISSPSHTDTIPVRNTTSNATEAYEYVRDSIKTDTAVSNIHGIGTFALCDIKKGEQVFTRWYGNTGEFTITKEQFFGLPKYVQNLILKTYENNGQGAYWFRLQNGSCFVLSNPYAYMNTAEENGNVDSHTGIALKDIKAGEEILGTYKLENTKPRLEVVK